MLQRYRFLLAVCMLMALVLPATAAERVGELPQIKPAMSARFDMALALNDQPFMVGKGEVVFPSSGHFVLKALAVPGASAEQGGRESTLEFVVYDNNVYVRADDDSQWYVMGMWAVPVAAPTLPEADLSDGPISNIGSASIAGVPTTQYQIWLNNEEAENDDVKLDLFIGKQINYLYQYQLSAFSQDEDIGKLKQETVFRMYDFDDPTIVVGPPANAIERPTPTSALIRPLRNGGFLSTLAGPLATAELHALAVQRFGR